MKISALVILAGGSLATLGLALENRSHTRQIAHLKAHVKHHEIKDEILDKLVEELADQIPDKNFKLSSKLMTDIQAFDIFTNNGM